MGATKQTNTTAKILLYGGLALVGFLPIAAFVVFLLSKKCRDIPPQEGEEEGHRPDNEGNDELLQDKEDGN